MDDKQQRLEAARQALKAQGLPVVVASEVAPPGTWRPKAGWRERAWRAWAAEVAAAEAREKWGGPPYKPAPAPEPGTSQEPP